MKLAQRQQGEGSSSKRRLGGTGRMEALGHKPAEHVESDGEISSATIVIPTRSFDGESDLYRGKSDGEILARYEF
jgi:hypothetical protein